MTINSWTQFRLLSLSSITLTRIDSITGGDQKTPASPLGKHLVIYKRLGTVRRCELIYISSRQTYH